ncbi:hypothetical protein [Halorientalis pallida]|nr:hypothetical protein [Halorientalis pallida]
MGVGEIDERDERPPDADGGNPDPLDTREGRDAGDDEDGQNVTGW